jgi:mono/diheme cytochrome c family protein
MNPVPRDSLLARGDTLFHTYCAVCHGGAGAGDGPVNVKLGGAARSLLTDNARALSDGFIYSMIRYGKGNMPRYGDKVYRHADRWAIVNYVRTLQAKGTSAVPDSTALSPSRSPAPAPAPAARP